MFSVILLFSLFYCLLLRENSTLWIGWAVFAGGIALGSLLSYLSYTKIRFAAIIIGAGAGASLAFVL